MDKVLHALTAATVVGRERPSFVRGASRRHRVRSMNETVMQADADY
jgi:hypothetical protein